jgi:ABC-type Fe3+-siderophore transport system permease subunit
VPWRIKRIIYLMVLGAILLSCATAVIVRNESADARLLAIGALAGAIAVWIVALPSNGDDD